MRSVTAGILVLATLAWLNDERPESVDKLKFEIDKRLTVFLEQEPEGTGDPQKMTLKRSEFVKLVQFYGPRSLQGKKDVERKKIGKTVFASIDGGRIVLSRGDVSVSFSGATYDKIKLAFLRRIEGRDWKPLE